MKNLVFKHRYDDLRKNRSIIENYDLGDVYKSVIERYNESLSNGDYLTSFLLIQSLFEDRCYVLYQIFIYQTTGSYLTLETFHKEVDLRKVIRELFDSNWLTETDYKTLQLSVNIRNKHIHFSFMGLESYDKELSETYYNLFREIDKMVQKRKRSTI
jgi:hypothetical protein